MSNNFVFRKTLHEIVATKIEPFIEKIFAQCNFESVQTSLLIEELVDSFSDQENYSTFRLILQRLFKPHVALTFDQFKREHLSKNLINLLYQYKFKPTYNVIDEDVEDTNVNKEDVVVIEKIHVNNVPKECLRDDTVCKNDTPNGRTELVNGSINNRISYKNNLVNVIEELKCENQYLKLQNDTLITGNPHAHCEIMNQQLIEELEKLETELKTKKTEQEETQQKKQLNMYEEESSHTDEYLQELEDLVKEEKDEIANIDVIDDYCYGKISNTKEINKFKLLEIKEHKKVPLLECKIQQINEEKNKLLEENERLKKEIEIRQKLRDTEIRVEDDTTAKCDHTDHNSTGTFEDLEELMSSIQNLEEENLAKDSLINEYKSQLYELQCYVKLTRQSTSPLLTLNSEVSTTVPDCRGSKTFEEELIELEHQKTTTADKNKSDSELLKMDSKLIKQNYNFITTQDSSGNSGLNMFDYEHSTTSEEDCDVSRISHWDCSQMNTDSFNVCKKETTRDSKENLLFDVFPTFRSDSNHTEQEIINISDLIDTSDPDFLPSPIKPQQSINNTGALNSVDVVNYNSAFLKNKRELIPRKLICNVLSNSIPEETSNEKDTDSKDENEHEDLTDTNENNLNQHVEISSIFTEISKSIENNISLNNLDEKIADKIINSKDQEEISNEREKPSEKEIPCRNVDLIYTNISLKSDEFNNHEDMFVRSEHLKREDISEKDEKYSNSHEEIFRKKNESFNKAEEINEKEAVSQKRDKQGVVLHKTKKLNNEEIADKGTLKIGDEMAYRTEEINEKDAISDQIHNLKERKILDGSQGTERISEATEYLHNQEKISDQTENFIQQEELSNFKNFKKLEQTSNKTESSNKLGGLVKDESREKILPEYKGFNETVEDSKVKFSLTASKENVVMDTYVQNDEIHTSNTRINQENSSSNPPDRCEDNHPILVNVSSTSNCGVDCNQCVNVKEVIHLFESLYRKNLSYEDCTGHKSCNKERQSHNNPCTNDKYKNIFNRMNDKLKEIEFHSENHSAFQHYREPNNDYPFEPRHVLTETLQKCLNEMNESFSQEIDGCENVRDETNLGDACNIFDLHDLIKDFDCLQLREESSAISKASQNSVLKISHQHHDCNAQNNKIDTTATNQIGQKFQLVPNKEIKRNKNQHLAINNNSQIKSNLHSVTINGEISRVTNNILQTVCKNTSLPNCKNDLNNSFRQNALVSSSKNNTQISTSFDSKQATKGYRSNHKRNNIESSHTRKANKNTDNQGGQKVNNTSVTLYQGDEHPQTSNDYSRSLNNAFNVSSTIRCTRKSTSQNNDTAETFTISGSAICRFSFHLVRLLMSLVVLFVILILALIWFQEQGRRQCPTCSQLLTFLGDILATKLEHLDGPPPI